MKTRLAILIALLVCAACQSAVVPPPVMRWRLETNNMLTLMFNVRSNVSYEFIRIDVENDYYSAVMHEFISTSNASVSITFDPKEVADEDQPTPGNVLWFYMAVVDLDIYRTRKE